MKIKVWWFKSRAKQILASSHPNNSLKFSDGWFMQFKCRYKISLRRPTNKAQKEPEEKEDIIRNFHQSIRKIQVSGEGDGPQEEKFKLCQIANMDQTPLHGWPHI